MPRNKVYLVLDPQSHKYKVTMELGLPEGFRTRFYAAAYVGDTKVANSDKAFTDDGICNLEFEHFGALDNVQDFAIRVGYDANSSATLDPGEYIKLAVHTGQTPATAEPMVRGSNEAAYNDAQNGAGSRWGQS